MTTTTSTLLIRKTTKTGYAQATKVPFKDSPARLQTWVDGLNESLGWNKYAVAHTEPVDAGAVNDGVVEPEDFPELTMEGEPEWDEAR